ncbi:MAG: sensor histidine kinase [Dehalococcoidia bacterium]|nr:sensor histidine kinase [Dehalococcoidia bacterium]
MGRRGFGASWVAALCALLAGCAMPGRLDGPIPRAELRVEPTTEEDVISADAGRRLPHPASEAVWQPVTLPIRVPRGQAVPGEPATAAHRVWIRLRHEVPAQSVGTLALYVPRLMVGFGAPEVLIDGERVEPGAVPGGADWNAPLLVVVPEAARRRGSFEVLITFGNRREAGFMVAAPYIGPLSGLRALADQRRLLTLDAPRGMSYALVVLGLFAFGFWWRRRREVTYLLFAMATLVWYVRTLHYFTGVPEPLVGTFWWLSLNSLSWLMFLVYLFAMRLQSRPGRGIARWLVALIAFTCVVTLPGLPLTTGAATGIAYVSQLLVATGVTGLLTVDAVRRGGLETRLLVGALWINLAFGAHDLLLHRFLLDPENLFLMPYGALFLFGAFLVAVTRRYASAIGEVETLNASLELRLAERTRELAASYERLQRVERERAVIDERQRLMREMHDGLGSSLMSSLVMVEQGRLRADEVAVVLRECIDDLKLTIDSLEPIGHDLVTLLATLRYRLGRRLELAGLRLDWAVGDLPPLPWLDPVNALHVLRVVQEMLTNVVKHAQASLVRIETDQHGGEVFVRVIDDGIGFDSRVAGSGRGLINMKRRAEQLGGRIDIERDAGLTRATLCLPVERRRTPEAKGAVPDDRRALGSGP